MSHHFEVDAGFRALYTTFPSLDRLRLHSVYLTPMGPTLNLRVDLPGFPDLPPPEWIDAGCDTVQLTLSFSGAEDCSLTSATFPAEVAISSSAVDGPLPLAAFEISGPSTSIRFTGIKNVKAGHISAYRSGNSAHLFWDRIDRRLYTEIPPPWTEVFHGRV